MNFPELPAQHFAIYLLVLLAAYIIVYGLVYRIVARRIQKGVQQELFRRDRVKTAASYLAIYMGFMMIFSVLQSMCEYIIMPLEAYEGLRGIFVYIRYLLMAVLLVLCILILFILMTMHIGNVLTGERKQFVELIQQKQIQYDFVKENANIINEKCHEIRKHLNKLGCAEARDHAAIIQQVQEAVNFYDAVVKTGNEGLDTILTQKSVLCASHGIKLTCMVTAEELSQVDVIDLYTILDLAIDNAIREVRRISETGKRLISLLLVEKSDMLYITIENYYEGKIVPDSQISKIKIVVKRYGGTMQINTENYIFLLQILLPLGQK
ncbi:MAG: ATP-binding protein [Lachnospiraceae bacterium]|nr:ATP-binding protein [Lachnospiraceae bacterium]